MNDLSKTEIDIIKVLAFLFFVSILLKDKKTYLPPIVPIVENIAPAIIEDVTMEAQNTPEPILKTETKTTVS